MPMMARPQDSRPPKAGTPIARDGDRTWTAPYADSVLVMPSLRHLKPGNTQVRLGRYA